MAISISTYSRQIITNSNGVDDEFTFEPEKLAENHVKVYLDYKPQTVNVDYHWTAVDKISFNDPPPAGSTIEMVRVTPRKDLSTTQPDLQLLYIVQEAIDVAALQNGRGPPLILDDDDSPSLLTNKNGLPVAQMLPNGLLSPSPDSVNQGGFNTASFRFENRITPDISPQSMPVAFYSVVMDESLDEADAKHSIYGMRVLFRSYQGASGGFPQSATAFNTIAETAKGVVTGKAESHVVEARHQDPQAFLQIGAGDSALLFTARPDTAYGAAGNGISVQILAPGASPGVTRTGLHIVITPDSAANTAANVAAMVNAHAGASQIVSVEAGGDGTGAVSASSSQNLAGGAAVDGKLVALQAILQPKGVDGGEGEWNADTGQIDFPGVDDAYPSYALACNANGFYPGFTAIIVKTHSDVGDPVEKGFHNGVTIEGPTCDSRYLWFTGVFAVQAPGFLGHAGVWMGIGTDEPETPLHS